MTIPTPAQPRPPKKKHWVRRIGLALLVLIALFAVVVQIVLWTDLPRGIVVRQIEQQLGLRLTVTSLSTGWLGNTKLKNVTIGLPLADHAFLEVPEMTVKNTSLFGLLMGQSVEVRSIELDRPHLHVLQGRDGTWNLAEVAELLALAGGKKTGEESAQSSSAVLPEVRITGGIISVVDNQARAVDIQPFSVEGRRDTGVTWKYDVEIPSYVHITGRLVPGGNWGHELAVKIQNVGGWAKPWAADFPGITVDASWRGALAGGGLAGRLDIQSIAITTRDRTANISGAVTAGMSGGAVTLHPDNLLLKLTRAPLSQIKLASGAIIYHTASNDLKVDQLFVALLGGIAKVSADYNVSAQTGQLTAGWEELSLPNGGTNQSGGLTATLAHPYPDKTVVDAHLDARGKQADMTWAAKVAMGMTGKSFADFDWNLHVDQLHWQRRDLGIKADGLLMAGGLHANVFSLDSVSMPSRDLIAGSARYSLTGVKPWSLHFEGRHWPVRPLEGTELAFGLTAHGDDNSVTVEQSFARTADGEAKFNASYVFSHPKPLSAELSITNAPGGQPPTPDAKRARLINGLMQGHFQLTGTIDPLQLEAAGHLNGRDIDIRGYHLGEIDFALSPQSHVDDNGAFFFTDSMDMFGGRWGIDGIYTFDTGELKVDVDLDGIAINKLAAVAGNSDVSGTLEGRLSVMYPWFAPDLDHLRVLPSKLTLRNVAAPQTKIDQIDATISLADGDLQIDPIVLTRNKGRGEVRVEAKINDLRRFDLAAKIDNWPIDIPGADAHIDASARLPSAVILLPDANAANPAAHKLRINAPQIILQASTHLDGKPLGELLAYAGIDGRLIDLRGFHAACLGGRFDGQAYVDLDNLLAATAEFTWEQLDFRELAHLFPQLDEFTGKLTGSARLAPTTVPRPLEPLALVVTTQFQHGAWRTLPIQDMRIAAYFGRDNTDGGWRAVLADSVAQPSFIHVADGTIEFWCRAGLHGRSSGSQAQISFRDLDLNKIVHAIDPTASNMPGKIAGSMMLLRAPLPRVASSGLLPSQMFPSPPIDPIQPLPAPNPHDPPLKALIDPIYGEGTLDLTRANLIHFGPFAFLYNAANLFQNARDSEGAGNVEFHLERGTMTIEHMRYFNRGTEIRAMASIEKLWQIPNSPIKGTVILTARPLSNVKLPIFSDIDTALTSVQQSLQLTAARVRGTVRDPRPSQLGLSQLGADMRNFIVGDAKSNGKQGAGG